MRHTLRMTVAFVSCAMIAAFAAAADPPPADATPDAAASEVLVTVGGQPITRGDLEFQFIIRKVPEDQRDAVRRRFLEQLVDRKLMQAFLDSRKAVVTPQELDAHVERLHDLIRRGGDEPEQLLARLGYSEQTLRRELALPLAWRNYARLIITQDRLRQYFEKHRPKFDGTELRARQIFLKAPDDVQRAAAVEKLAAIRTRIVGGEMPFAEAARLHSEAPTSAVGGDVGFFPYKGRMPEAFTREAFQLQLGEVGQPFSTPFGVHLVTVTEVRPGQLSLEDARGRVFDALSGELWDGIVRQEREKTRIEWAAGTE